MDRLARSLNPQEMKIAFAFLLTMPGAPFIYYGDEIGMRYVEGLVSKEGGYGRTGARSPMQWDSSKNAGFSSADKKKLYIPQDPAPDRPTVKQQIADKSSLWHEVNALISLRMQTPALQNLGEIEFIETGYPLVYKRIAADGKACMVIINPSQKKCEVKMKEGQVLHITGKGAEYKNGCYKVEGGTAVIINLA